MAVLPTPASPMKSGLFLRAAGEDLDGALDLVVAADERIDATLRGLWLRGSMHVGRERVLHGRRPSTTSSSSDALPARLLADVVRRPC